MDVYIHNDISTSSSYSRSIHTDKPNAYNGSTEKTHDKQTHSFAQSLKQVPTRHTHQDTSPRDTL
jgi:hypothetical protein